MPDWGRLLLQMRVRGVSRLTVFVLATARRVLSISSSSSSALGARLYERQLGRPFIIGCDEAGRGPLAGPVVVAAVCCLPGTSEFVISEAGDSKKLSSVTRAQIYSTITSRPDQFAYAISIIDNEEIDRINILQATLKGMTECITFLVSTLGVDPEECAAIVDGNKTPPQLKISARPLVKGDALCYSVALASCVAKHVRDEMMIGYHKQFPLYNFVQHKGYPTKEHQRLIHLHGPCPIHRMTFSPLKGRVPIRSEEPTPSDLDSTSSNKQ